MNLPGQMWRGVESCQWFAARLRHHGLAQPYLIGVWLSVYEYDQVFGEDVSQEQLYSTSVKPVVDQVLKGIDAAVLAYGQTGTGKSFTVMGDLRSESLRGITPRAVEQIFQELGRDSAGGEQYTVELTYLEVYNEVCSRLIICMGGLLRSISS